MFQALSCCRGVGWETRAAKGRLEVFVPPLELSHTPIRAEKPLSLIHMTAYVQILIFYVPDDLLTKLLPVEYLKHENFHSL